MKKVAVVLMVYMVCLAALRVEAVKQRVPISISGSEIAANSNGFYATRSRLVTSNFTSSVSNQLVMAVDLSQNTIEIEEWDAALSNRVDRQPLAGGTQSIVYASYVMSKVISARTNTITFASDLENGDPTDSDWNNDGVSDHFGDLSIQGTFYWDRNKILTNRQDSSIVITGVITGVRATMQGVLNDPIAGSNGVNRVFTLGRASSTRAKTFLVDELP